MGTGPVTVPGEALSKVMREFWMVRPTRSSALGCDRHAKLHAAMKKERASFFIIYRRKSIACATVLPDQEDRNYLRAREALKIRPIFGGLSRSVRGLMPMLVSITAPCDLHSENAAV